MKRVIALFYKVGRMPTPITVLETFKSFGFSQLVIADRGTDTGQYSSAARSQ